MNLHYILDDANDPVSVDLMTWARWLEDANKRRVARDTIPGFGRVSTVFLGLDHSFSLVPGHAPILWETMTFPTHGWSDTGCWRHASHEVAKAFHDKLVADLTHAALELRKLRKTNIELAKEMVDELCRRESNGEAPR